MRGNRVVIVFVAGALLSVGCSSVVGGLGAGRFETPLIAELSRITTDNEADEINPVWSPDASTLLYVKSSSFASRYSIWQLDLSRQLHANLTESFSASTLNPTWSPDGRRVAFFSRSGADYNIWTLDFSSAPHFTKLIDDDHMNIFPAWSPDGTEIAFVSDRSGEAAVWTMNVDGSALRRLTEGGFGDLTPAWSPDGSSLAFVRRVKMELDQTEKDEYYKSLDELSQTSLEGPSRETLYKRLEEVFDLPGRIRVSHLYILNVKNDRLRQLSFDETEDGRPVWSPDGLQLVFSSRRNGNLDLWLIDADGTNLRRVTSHPADDRYPAWSPDGRQITFASNRSGSTDIWTLTLNADRGE